MYFCPCRFILSLQTVQTLKMQHYAAFYLGLHCLPKYAKRLICAVLVTEKYTTWSGWQWLSGRVLYSRQRGRGFDPHRRHCVVSLSKNINPSLVLVQPRKTRPFITESLLMGRKKSIKQTWSGF